MMFDRPAENFREAFPLGNGRIGAMVFGGMTKERVILNETSLWSGSDSYEYPGDVYTVLPEIQRLVLEGEYRKAQDLYEKAFLVYKPMPMDGANCALLPYGSAQNLCELNLSFFQFASGCNQEWYPFEIKRELDFEEAVASVTHRSFWHTNTPGYNKGVTYQRKAFVSQEGECFAMKLTANRDSSISFNAQLNRSESFVVAPAGNDGILLSGQLSDGLGGKGVKYACLLRVIIDGGAVETDHTVLKVRGANSAVLLVTMATDMKFYGSRNLEDPVAAVAEDMARAVMLGWDTLLEDNIALQKKYFHRNSFSINEPEEALEALPIDTRLIRKGLGEPDEGLFVLMYNYGRYLLISASRPEGMPLGIMGIWGEEIQSPFNGDYHLNAQQITYWAAECCNLSELHMPYLKLAEALQEPGSRVAKAFYGSGGWVAHTFTNPWLFALPGGEVHWGATITGGAWLCVHLWEHFLYNNEDMDFLAWAYPIMKGAAEFLLDRLITVPQTGKKVVFPGNSPENYFVDAQGREVALCEGTTYDMEITRYFFNACIEAAGLLGKDGCFAERLRNEIAETAETRIASDGRILEWQHEHREAKRYHRHISPLWGAFPGDAINTEDTPALAAACVKLIDERTFTGHSWAMVHRMGVLARLYEAERIYDILNQLMRYGIFTNLLCHEYFTLQDETTPETDLQDPFQYNNIFEIDGNTGFPAIIAEMLMQSYRQVEWADGGGTEPLRVIQLLCALPQAWRSGRIEGLKARGSYIVDIEWENNALKTAAVKGKKGSRCVVRYAGRDVLASFEPCDTVSLSLDDFQAAE